MKANRFICRLSFFLIILLIGKNAIADTTYVKFGSVWKYLDKGAAAPANWRTRSFNDASWKSGPAEFGYGENKERTTIHFGANARNKYITTYFRKTISIANLASYHTIRINAYVDDGAIIYVNGNEVARMNLLGKPTYATLASDAEENGNEFNTFNLPASAFVNGINLVAVEVHQSSPDSPDLTFDLELLARTETNALPNATGSLAAEPDVSRGPYLQMVSSNAITIRWTTTYANSSRIKFGTDENSLKGIVTDNANVTEHEMRITNLKPDTKYFYAIGSRNSILKGSYRNYFNTSPLANTTRKIRIGVFGDPGTGSIMQKNSRDSYIRLKAGYNNSEMIIMLGDNAYNSGRFDEYSLHFFNIYNNNILDNHVLFPVPGNHEYANDATRAADHNIPYYNVFTVPANGESGGLPSGTEHYYSYDYGNIHFIMLDSYGIDGGNHLYDDTTNGLQAVWLKADLTANEGKHKWTIVCMHHPPYTNGSHISDNETDLIQIRRKITPILERFGVDVVLAGHSHVYERSFLIKDHIGFAESFNKGSAPGGTAISLSSARYDGSLPNRKASADSSSSTSACPYFTIDSVYKHGTVYVVAGSAGQINSNNSNTYPLFYTRNQANSKGGESGALYLEIQDNRLDAKFVGNSGTIRDQFTIMKGVNKKMDINAVINKPVLLSASWPGGYNWYAASDASIKTLSNARSFTVKPPATGNFTYYVADSIGTDKTCIADTFMLHVTSSMAVSVTKFDAVAKDKKISVQWLTEKETKSDYFTVERSADGNNFNLLMVISAKGISDTPTRYEFTDNEPLPGTIYYRLIATDKNNDKKIAGTCSVINLPGKSDAVQLINKIP